MSEISQRKDSHIKLAGMSQVQGHDDRFNYEPLLGGFPSDWRSPSVFLGKKIEAPLWVSSMTGGSSKGKALNKVLATVASKFGLGMGLGSCRALLEDSKKFDDFNLRPILGDGLPFYANIGVAQVEALIQSQKLNSLGEMVEKLSCDGLVVHINPLQEYFQPGGDKVIRPALETLRELTESLKLSYVIKEVGQGMGPESLRSLIELNVDAIELAAHGGTNFTKLEGMRSETSSSEDFSKVGHTALEMIEILNTLSADNLDVIISGGVNNVLDAHFLKSRCGYNSVIGKASSLLFYAEKGESELSEYVEQWLRDYQLAVQFLKVKSEWN